MAKQYQPSKKHSTDALINPEAKIMPLDQLLERAREWRHQAMTIVFTNGCFDLLHVGHVTLLDQARREGHCLVVGINSDKSVRELKGPTRPIVAEHARARVLAALSAVDAVVIFNEPTPLNLMLALRPDVIVKGGDYNAECIIGSNEVQSWGGKVKIINYLDGFSTTQLITQATAQKKSS